MATTQRLSTVTLLCTLCAVHGLTDYAWLTAVGTRGTILRSDDAGSSWFPQVSGTNVTLRAVAMLSAREIVVVGDLATVLYSRNGGRKFVPLDVEGTSENLTAVDFVQSHLMFAVGLRGTIIVCNLEEEVVCQSRASHVTVDLRSVIFIGNRVGFAFGDSGLCGPDGEISAEWCGQIGVANHTRTSVALRTFDSGIFWEMEKPGLETSFRVSTLEFDSASFNILVAGVNENGTTLSRITPQAAKDSESGAQSWSWTNLVGPVNVPITFSAMEMNATKVLGVGNDGVVVERVAEDTWEGRCQGLCSAIGHTDLTGVYLTNSRLVVVGGSTVFMLDKEVDAEKWTTRYTAETGVVLFGLAGRDDSDHNAAALLAPGQLLPLLVLAALACLA